MECVCVCTYMHVCVCLELLNPPPARRAAFKDQWFGQLAWQLQSHIRSLMTQWTRQWGRLSCPYACVHVCVYVYTVWVFSKEAPDKINEDKICKDVIRLMKILKDDTDFLLFKNWLELLYQEEAGQHHGLWIILYVTETFSFISTGTEK